MTVTIKVTIFSHWFGPKQARYARVIARNGHIIWHCRHFHYSDQAAINCARRMISAVGLVEADLQSASI